MGEERVRERERKRERKRERDGVWMAEEEEVSRPS